MVTEARSVHEDDCFQPLTEGGRKYQSTEDDRFCLYETNKLTVFMSRETTTNIITLLTSTCIHFSSVFKTCKHSRNKHERQVGNKQQQQLTNSEQMLNKTANYSPR